jgi:broad specificity phosphatase PhoE
MSTTTTDHFNYTLYLIRHGEAEHNVQEKVAEEKAKQDAIAEGYDPDSGHVRVVMEEARKQVLNDPALFDAPLTEQGRVEAQQARERLNELLQSMPNVLQEPSEVLVSSLQRALQTADIIFPPSASKACIRVRDELQERQTGKPPDTRSSSASLRRRITFERFSMSRLRDMPWFRHLFGSGEGSILNEEQVWEDHEGVNDAFKQQEEDKAMLRQRTQQLFSLLIEAKNNQHIAVVTHKGYLRELEHGPLGQKNTPEFKNCEIRVYKIDFTSGCQDLNIVERLV